MPPVRVAVVAGYPRRFGSYVLLKPLARGGMGELDLAVTGERRMEKLCAIKKVLPHLLAGDNVQRFRDEAMVMVRLSHGNLVGVIDAGREEGQFYLAMDFVEGKDLLATWNRCATKRVAFPIEVAVYIIKELARGLAYAHAFRELNLVHRDISPANLLLSYSGEVRLTDFGLATSKLKEQRTAPGIIFGKMAYLAPEQARGEPLDCRTDLYSAGILLWEMLTGQQLFPMRQPSDLAPRGRDSTVEALDRVKYPRIQAPSKITSRVPPELDEIVMRALAPEPARRYAHGEALRADLAGFLAQTAPETDAATLASFMSLLFEEHIAGERNERDQLLARADDAGLLTSSDRLHPVPGAPSAVPAPATAASGTTHEVDVEVQVEAEARAEPEAQATPDPGPGAPAGHPGASTAGAEPWWQRPADQDPRVDTTIGGRYYLRRLCGEGAMGRVYEGHHVEIGRRVAVKILHASYSHTPDVVERFRREARAASRIGHPNIVDVTDSGVTSDGCLFFVMDYLEGLNLEQTIARGGPLPVERALLIAAQVARALVAAHTAGIIHRDLKPANVMLGTQRDGEDFVKVLDFGISKQSAREGESRNEAGLTRPDAAVGTPIYMAPEQISGQPADARTDVYALGELLYEMLAGVPPYDGSDVMVVFNRKANQEPKPILTLRPELSPAIDRVISRAMSRRPEDRHQNMTELKDDVLGCLVARDAAGISPGSPPGFPAQVLPLEKTAAAPQPRRPSKRGHGPKARTLWIMLAGASLGLGSAALVVLDGVPPRARSLTAGFRRAHVAERAGGPPAPLGADPPPARAPASIATLQIFSTEPPASPPIEGPRGAATPRPAASRTPAPRRPTTPPRLDPGSHLSGPAAASPADTPASSAIRGSTNLSASEWLMVGRAAFAKGNFPESVRAARAALATTPSADAYLLLGDTYFKMERFSDAIREYSAALALAPDNTHARRGRDLATHRLLPSNEERQSVP